MTTQISNYEVAHEVLSKVAREQGTTVVQVDRGLLECLLDGQDPYDERRDHLRRIHQLFCAMPFGGLCHFARPDQPEVSHRPALLTLEQVAENLDKLRTELERQVDEQSKEREELGRYRRLMSSVRDIVALITTGDSTT